MTWASRFGFFHRLIGSRDVLSRFVVFDPAAVGGRTPYFGRRIARRFRRPSI